MSKLKICSPNENGRSASRFFFIAFGLLDVYRLSNSNVSLIRNLVDRQNHICPICGEKLFTEDEKLYYKINENDVARDDVYGSDHLPLELIFEM